VRASCVEGSARGVELVLGEEDGREVGGSIVAMCGGVQSWRYVSCMWRYVVGCRVCLGSALKVVWDGELVWGTKHERGDLAEDIGGG
jgi:hypothetical protein